MFRPSIGTFSTVFEIFDFKLLRVWLRPLTLKSQLRSNFLYYSKAHTWLPFKLILKLFLYLVLFLRYSTSRNWRIWPWLWTFTPLDVNWGQIITWLMNFMGMVEFMEAWKLNYIFELIYESRNLNRKTHIFSICSTQTLRVQDWRKNTWSYKVNYSPGLKWMHIARVPKDLGIVRYISQVLASFQFKLWHPRVFWHRRVHLNLDLTPLTTWLGFSVEQTAEDLNFVSLIKSFDSPGLIVSAYITSKKDVVCRRGRFRIHNYFKREVLFSRKNIKTLL